MALLDYLGKVAESADCAFEKVPTQKRTPGSSSTKTAVVTTLKMASAKQPEQSPDKKKENEKLIANGVKKDEPEELVSLLFVMNTHKLTKCRVRKIRI